MFLIFFLSERMLYAQNDALLSIYVPQTAIKPIFLAQTVPPELTIKNSKLNPKKHLFNTSFLHQQ